MGDLICTPEEMITMLNEIALVCQSSGCTVLDALYALAKAVDDEKRICSPDEIIEMYEEWLTRLDTCEDH